MAVSYYAFPVKSTDKITMYPFFHTDDIERINLLKVLKLTVTVTNEYDVDHIFASDSFLMHKIADGIFSKQNAGGVCIILINDKSMPSSISAFYSSELDMTVILDYLIHEAGMSLEEVYDAVGTVYQYDVDEHVHERRNEFLDLIDSYIKKGDETT